MSTIIHSSGLRVTLPDGWELCGAETETQKRTLSARPVACHVPGVVPMPQPANAPAFSDEVSAIAAALGSQDLTLIGMLPIDRTPQPDGARAIPSKSPIEVAVEVDLEHEEDAIMMLEQDGVYSWLFDAAETPPPAVKNAPRRGQAKLKRQVTFKLPLGSASADTRQSRGWLKDLVVGRVQAFVFKFAGRFLLSQGAAFLERKIQPGLVLLDGDDPGAWKKLPDFSALNLPTDRPARILLFIHGTFSSTCGGFGALAATPWGKGFLAAARANYDVVIGFDHPSLSIDPLANATALLRSLESRAWQQTAVIDAISHSRGGITLRSLIEYLLPAASVPVRIERAVFVGATNGGTTLAEPKNWRSFINTYTNVAAGACRAIAMFPQVTIAATLLAEMLKGVGVLAKVLANEAITEQMIPGLAAMQPQGKFITNLNETQPRQPTAGESRYYAVTSEFRSRLALDSMKELPRQLLLSLADGITDRLLGEGNDLVVNTASMTCVDPQVGGFIKDTLAFGPNGVVYHTNYFLQPQVTNALARWFELEPPQVASPARSRGIVANGEQIPISVPARVDTDVLVALSDEPAGELFKRIQSDTPSHIVVERPWNQKLLRYAFQAEEVLAATANRPGDSILDVLNLQETDASPECAADTVPESISASSGQRTLRRFVALDDGRVIGVADMAVKAIPTTELVEQSKILTAPATVAAQILQRRALPTLISRPLRSLEPTMVRTTRGLNLPKVAGGIEAEPASASAADGESIAPPKVSCHFLAQMDDVVLVGETTSVDVTLSREIVGAIRAVSATGESEVSPDRKIAVEIIPKKNFVCAGQNRLDLPPPLPGKSSQYSFEVTATDVGDGEVVVRICQELQQLAELILKTRIVTQRSGPTRRKPEDVRIMETAPVVQPRHELAIMEIERGGKLLYHFTLRSPSLGFRNMYESNPLTGVNTREEYIKGLYNKIEQRYLGNHDDFDQFQQELREFGAELWDELFPPQLQADLWNARDAIDSILVFSDEPFVPWELVHLKAQGQGLGPDTRFFGQMGLVRWLSNVGWPTQELRARAGHCYFVAPQYPHPDFTLPCAAEEADLMKKIFNAEAVEPHAGPVRRLLATPGAFDLLHFACHGIAALGDITGAALLLEGRIQGNEYVTEILRASTVEQAPNFVGGDGVHPIITLNACQTGRAGYKLTSIGGFSRAFLKNGAGMLVAALWSVGDQPARTFAEELYKRLLAGDTLAQATISARSAARTARESTWLSYSVYGNPNAKLRTYP